MPSKGRETEFRAVDIWKSIGEIYHPPSAKYRNQDVFELFDLLVYRAGELHGIQLKTNAARGVTNWFHDVQRYRPAFNHVAFAVLHEQQGWRLARPEETGPVNQIGENPTDGYEWVFDGREGGPRTEEKIDYELAKHLMTQYTWDGDKSQPDGAAPANQTVEVD